MAKRSRDLRVAGISISFTTLGYLALAVWIKAMGIMFDDWFVEHNLAILIVSSIAVVFCVAIGAITLRSWIKNINPLGG